MHTRLSGTYGSLNFTALSENDKGYKRIKAAFNKAAKHLRSKGTFNSTDLKHKEVKPLITETFKVLKSAVSAGIETEIPQAMLDKLHNDVFVFSGMKTYTQLKEASLLLLDGNGKVKSEAAFIQDVQKINNTYNENYLKTERNYALNAAQSAAQWHEYSKEGDRYDLQIRTAADDKVRQSHAVLHNLTLPFSSTFWLTHWTPFDWGCRCRIIQVLKGKYDHTPSEEAATSGAKAVPEMFRYNPGKQQVVFPPKHPYYPQHCSGAKLNVSRLIGFSKAILSGEEDRCKAKDIVQGMSKGGALENEYKKSIFEKPINEQYQSVFKSKTGKQVLVHQLANESREKYADIIYAAKAMANKNITVKVQPVININDDDARLKVFPGYTHPTANAELLTEHGYYIDVKAPKAWKNINGLAVHASMKQGAEVLITDVAVKIDVAKIESIASRIFLDKNYTKDVVHFVVKGQYYNVKRP